MDGELKKNIDRILGIKRLDTMSPVIQQRVFNLKNALVCLDFCRNEGEQLKFAIGTEFGFTDEELVNDKLCYARLQMVADLLASKIEQIEKVLKENPPRSFSDIININ